jgi:flagellar hook-length control protein FliK
MNSPALLIGAATSAAAPAVTADATSAEEGFSSALASSIAGLTSLADCVPEETLPEPAAIEDQPSLADVAQWLGLPISPAPVAASAGSAGEAVAAQSADTDTLTPEEQLSAAAVTKLDAARSGKIIEAAATGSMESDADDLESLVPAAFAALDSGVAAPAAAAPAATASLPGVNALPPALTLTNALIRDGATSAPADAPVRASLHQAVGSARWADELGSRLVMMSVRGQQEGSLTLTPEHLGPLEIQISVSKDTANVWFGAQHADTRTALTEALPRLRELLAASGLSLGQTGVSEQTPRRPAPASDDSRRSGPAAISDGVSEVTAPAWRHLRAGLIDTYA